MHFLDKSIRPPFSNRTIPVRYALVHAAYWVLITGFFLYEKRYLIHKASLPYFVACVVVRIVLLIGIAYLNNHYFLPRYLLKGRYLRYFSLIVLSVLGYMLVQSAYDYWLYGFIVGPTRNNDWFSILWYNFFSTLWYLGLMVALKLSIDWYEQQRLLQRIAIEKLQTEVNYLRAQVNPHFLFNILNSLYALTLKKSDLAPEVVLKLSAMMEYMLYDSDEARVPLDKEIEYLRNYIELERLRCGDHSEIVLEIKGQPNRQEIAPLLLLPLVENAFKHGVSQQTDHPWLHSTLQLEPEGVEMTVENNKPIAPPVTEKGGIGLTNLRKRLELLYPGLYHLSIDEQPTRFRVTLQISLQ